MKLADLIDISVVHKLADANYAASGMPVGLTAVDGTVLVAMGWQDICTMYHRASALAAQRCRESDEYIHAHLFEAQYFEYTCRNGLRDIGIPILVGGEHLATLFVGQFFYEGETPDRAFFMAQARAFGFDEKGYLAALDRVPVVSRAHVQNILRYNAALASFISGICEGALERRRIEEELRAASRAKDEFLGMLSHELRNPLAPIRSSLYILENSDPESDRARRAREIAGRQLTHLTRLVDDLLDVTRIARGKVELRRHLLDLTELARRTAEDQRAQLEARRLRFEVQTPPDAIWVDADETRLAQVIANLLQNAAKFTPEEGRVTLSVAEAGEHVELRVSDTGRGIEPDLLRHLFQPFVQAAQPLARSQGGLGLGLALVKGLTELHGGTVDVTSAGTDQGATFTVRLPRIVDAALAVPDVQGAQPRCDRLRVLVVDDNHDAAESLADLVRMLGHDAEVAFDGWTAVQQALAAPPDMVLCDIGLPRLSGYEVAQALRSDPRLGNVHLIAVSGYAQPEDRKRALEAGFVDHIPKPADPARVVRALAEWRSMRSA